MSKQCAEWRERAAQYRRQAHAAIDAADKAVTIELRAESLVLATECLQIAETLEIRLLAH